MRVKTIFSQGAFRIDQRDQVASYKTMADLIAQTNPVAIETRYLVMVPFDGRMEMWVDCDSARDAYRILSSFRRGMNRTEIIRPTFKRRVAA